MSARLTPGDEAPAFTLPDADGNEVSLADHKGRKVIVYFYPAALTPGCTKQACDFTDNLDLLVGAGYDVIGISPDKPEKLAKFREQESLKVTPPRRPGQEGPGRLRRVRREEELRPHLHGRHPLHDRRRRTGQGRTRPLQRPRHRPRSQDHQGPGHLSPPSPRNGPYRNHGTGRSVFVRDRPISGSSLRARPRTGGRETEERMSAQRAVDPMQCVVSAWMWNDTNHRRVRRAAARLDLDTGHFKR